MKNGTEEHQLSRRTFLKGSALTALAATAGAGGALSLFGCSQAVPVPESKQEIQEKIIWSMCGRKGGCGAVMCPIQIHNKNGTIAYIEPDNTGSDVGGEQHVRACLKGRSWRWLINSPDRLRYPMKRVGKRGEGKFECISWEEAENLFYEKLKDTMDKYGNEAIFRTDSGPSNSGPCARLFNLLGGHLDAYGSDSCGQIIEGSMYLLGGMDSSKLLEAMNADLLVMFGNSPGNSTMGGAAATYDLMRVRESGTRIVNIDYRLNDSSAGHPDEWLPIRNGTDAALASAINYVLIKEGFADEEFLHQYCIGYDQQTMPEGAPANSSYKDYILGTGYDKIPKTPEWAAPITLIPAEKIYELAREIGNAKAAYITQGWGPQRHSNGENACRAIMMVAIISGHIGLPGTNAGGRDLKYSGTVPEFGQGIPAGVNPVKAQISCISRIEVIDHGEKMTALRDGVRGVDKLSTRVKFFVSHDTNLFNQSCDFNHTHNILVDESKCEFITVIDVVLTPTGKYADLLLPDVTSQERVLIKSLLTGGAIEGVVFGQVTQEPQFECRDDYEFYAAVAEKFGVKDNYTEGRTWAEWQYFIYDQAKQKRADLPTLEEGLKMGLWKKEFQYPPALSGFRSDPEKNPLKTPSGKIEIYSPRLQKISETWQLDNPKDIISPIPIYNPGSESYEDTNDKYPLVLSGWHPRQRIHSTFGGVELLQKALIQEVWINPLDAGPRGIQNGNMVKVCTMRGEVHIQALVTPRIMPGIIGIPQGAWNRADMFGDKVDTGGNINTLTGRHWSPLAKHNPCHNSIAQVEKL